MRHSGVLLGALLLFSLQAGAQINTPAPLFLGSPVQVLPTTFTFTAAPIAAESAANPDPATPTPAPAMPQEVQGIYGDYYTQVFIGVTYLKFFEIPSDKPDMGGVDLAMAYYLKPWVAADLEVFDAVGRDNGQTANFFFFGGGPRLRWQTSHGLEFWIHGLGGFATYNPTTIYGHPTAGAVELGGGVDFGRPHRRWVYRVQADTVGTFLFGVHQFSPRVATGIVLKF